MTPEEAADKERWHAAQEAGDTDTARAIEAKWDRQDRETRERLTAPGALLGAAKYYAMCGIKVFPLQPGIGYDKDGKPKGKKPLFPRLHPKDHPCQGECGKDGHGLYDGTTDVDRISRWWRAAPQANIGVRTGELFTVIDVDLPLGYHSLGLMREKGQLPRILGRVQTPSGGTHLYVPPTDEGNSTGAIPGIDIRGIGGYTVAPPSKNEEGLWIWTSPLNLEGADE